jgi:Skp family chaperone for outer membrane proteins
MQGAPSFKVGVVYLQECFDKYEGTKVAEQELTRQRDEGKKKLEELQKRVNTLREEYEALVKSGMDPEKLGELRIEKFQDYKKAQYELELRRKIEEARLTDMYGEYQLKIYNEICAMIKRIATEHGFEIVFRADQALVRGGSPESISQQMASRSVLYADPRFNITGLIIDRLNKAYREKKGERK